MNLARDNSRARFMLYAFSCEFVSMSFLMLCLSSIGVRPLLSRTQSKLYSAIRTGEQRNSRTSISSTMPSLAVCMLDDYIVNQLQKRPKRAREFSCRARRSKEAQQAAALTEARRSTAGKSSAPWVGFGVD